MSNRAARLILALGRQRAKMPKSWQKLAVELAIKAIHEHEKSQQNKAKTTKVR